MSQTDLQKTQSTSSVHSPAFDSSLNQDARPSSCNSSAFAKATADRRPSTAARDWYCIRSTVGYEARAAELLARTSAETKESTGEIEVYCPQIRKMMSVAGKKRPVLSPLFPGYLFARFELSTAARYVASRPGIIGLVRFSDQPASVPAEVIDELRATDFETIVQALSAFAPGQKLVIKDGPFAGMEAQYVASMNDGHRALLLLEYLNRQVNVVVESSALEAAA